MFIVVLCHILICDISVPFMQGQLIHDTDSISVFYIKIVMHSCLTQQYHNMIYHPMKYCIMGETQYGLDCGMQRHTFNKNFLASCFIITCVKYQFSYIVHTQA